MRVLTLSAAILAVTATVAAAQYQPYQPPNLSDAYQRSLSNIYNSARPETSYDVRPGPYGDYSITPRSGTGPSVNCRRGPYGDYSCQ
jgi:hypothetical protein